MHVHEYFVETDYLFSLQCDNKLEKIEVEQKREN